MNSSFKFYKSKQKILDLGPVIDCSDKDEDKIIKIVKPATKTIAKIGLQPLANWEIYRFKSTPGLILIKNPFTAIAQRYWIRKLVQEYTKYPNPNNLLPTRFNESTIKDFWVTLCQENEQQRRLIKKSMRWTTLGYHYDWTAKIYDENKKNEFPAELRQLISTIAEVLDFRNYKSEAAIINFYPIGSTLSAHTDHSERNLDSPLFSISFGQSAIFLIGGRNRDDGAIPILLNSGDIVIMSEESRLCYHAVPRVFESSRQPWNDNEDTSECTDLNPFDVQKCLVTEDWHLFDNYLMDTRLNVNVRQVNK